MDYKTIKVSEEAKLVIDQLYKRFKPLPRYEIIYHSVKFFLDTGYDPRHFAGNLPAMEMQKLNASVNKMKDDIIKVFRGIERDSIKPLARNSHALVYKVSEYIRDNGIETNDLFLKEDSKPDASQADWLKDFKKDTEAIEKRKEEKSQANKNESSNELDKMTIKYQKMKKEYDYLLKDYRLLASKIKQDTHRMKQVYVVDIDDIEYQKIMQK